MADKYLTLTGEENQLEEIEATVVSNGLASAGKIIALDQEGQLDPSIVAGDSIGTISLLSSVNLSQGQFVHVFNDSGVPKLALADSTSGNIAHGFVKEDIIAGDSTILYSQGINIFVSGLLPGITYFLGTNGSISTTPPATSGSAVQIIGKAVAQDKIIFDPVQPVIRS